MSAFISLSPDRHVYHDKNGNQYTSVSKLIGALMPVFQESIIAQAIAKRDNKTVEAVKAEWKQKKDLAVDHGNHIHKNIESYMKDHELLDQNMHPFLQKFSTEFSGYNLLKHEDISYSLIHLIAGMLDIKAYRSRKVMDIFDYKTNLSRGIQYFDKYGKYMTEPVSHLEACNYNEYALKMSVYALLIQITEGYKIGRMGLYFISDHHKGEWNYIPIPYMKTEAEAILTNHMETNKINPIMDLNINSAFN